MKTNAHLKMLTPPSVMTTVMLMLALLAVLAASPADAQGYAAIMSLEEGSGNRFWPNGGDIPVIAFGWGSQRPLPIEVAVDSARVPFFGAGETPVLTVQRRRDGISPFIQEAFAEQYEIEAATFTLNGVDGGPVTYTLFDIRIIGVREVGGYVAETQPTEEIVFAFSRMTLPGQ